MKKLFLIAAIILGLGIPASANEVMGIRHSSSAERTRLVIDTQDQPIYQITANSSRPQLVIEIFDTDEAPLKLSSPNSPFIKSWKADFPNIKRFRLTIDLKYALPAEFYSVQTLENPHRLAVDIAGSGMREENYALTPGITWQKREYFGGPEGYLLWNKLFFDPHDPNVSLRLGLASDNMKKNETVSSITARKGALAGVNGGYFNMAGGPLGIVMADGKLLSPHVSRRPPRTVLGMTANKDLSFKRAVAANGQIKDLNGNTWDNLELALGGGPTLLKGGKLALTTDAEELGPKGNDITRRCGRTAIGTTKDGKCVIALASGYSSSHSQGITLEKIATLMHAAGAVEAMNLDGGGSVDLSLKGQIAANGPGAGTYERPVADMLLVYDSRPDSLPASIRLVSENRFLIADGISRMKLTAIVRDASGRPVPDDTPVVISAENAMSCPVCYTKNGEAIFELTVPRKVGQAIVKARSGLVSSMLAFNLSADAPARLSAKITDIKVQAVKTPQTGVTDSEDSGQGTDNSAGNNQQAEDAIDSGIGNDPEEAPQDEPIITLTPTFHAEAVILAEDKYFNGVEGVPVKASLNEQELGTFKTEADGQLFITIDKLTLPACLLLETEGTEPVVLEIDENYLLSH